MLLKLAWRNLWRNKRRTLITLASIFFAVVLSSLMMSMKEGTYTNMIDSMVGAHIGYIQVQDSAYAKDASIDDLMQFDQSVQNVLDENREITDYAPRLQSFALAASRDVTKGVLVVGGDLEAERRVHQLDQRVVQGHYPSAGSGSALIGSGLAEYLNLQPGDTIVLLGQGYHGMNAAGKYPVAGILKYGSPELSKQLVFLPLPAAQGLYGADHLISSVIIEIHHKDKVNMITRELNSSLPPRLVARTWEEIMPELKNMIETDRVEGYVFMFILYMVITFGILGTLIMMISERRREFGILISIGMKKLRLATTFLIEIIILAIIGAILGILGAFPVCAYFHVNPIRFGDQLKDMMEEYGIEAILQTSLDPSIYIQQAIIVCIVSIMVTMYPFYKITRLRVMNAIRT